LRAAPANLNHPLFFFASEESNNISFLAPYLCSIHFKSVPILYINFALFAHKNTEHIL
jgi:hypothetical protein